MKTGADLLEHIAEEVRRVQGYPWDFRQMTLKRLEQQLYDGFLEAVRDAEAARQAAELAGLQARVSEGRKWWMAELPGDEADRRGVIERWEAGAATREDRRAIWGVVQKDWDVRQRAGREMHLRTAHGRLLEVKAAGDGADFVGYASTFGTLDRSGEVMLPGAFKRTIPEFLADGWIALNHKHELPPVAYPVAAVEDRDGLLIGGKFHSHGQAQDCRTVVRERMAAGKSVGLSIGFLTAPGGCRAESRGGEAVRVISDVDLFEVSICNLPADPNARVLSA